ncbi:hypothetical protein NLI96_g1019 [Meripilus lineatus]|uniref:DUF6535 domain-containing protein n=1 Tax=Meripilus lineatus TaxID=2056292 RepID=A0AAD5YIS5_9APHY|nr:hypothetical protein NLI96_g1019 [Physisporinus lineatus]
MATQSPESNAPTPPPEPETKAKDSTITKASFESLEHDVNVGRRVTAAKHPQAIFAKNPEAWPRLSKTLENHDEAKIGSYKEDIDTLLVFAGLFSAVLAAFIVEAYKLLQPESGQLTIQLLSQISQQLNSFTVNPAFVNSTLQTTVPIQISSDFKPSTSVFFVNLLWFLALILCLVTASLGMLVKQWLREYLANDSTSPQALARIRFSRLRSLETWHVFSIASALPTLLQLALTFFLIALCLFVHQFHYALFCCITTVVAMFFVFYAYLMFAPLFSSRCPYKSPSLKSTTQSIRRGIHVSIRKILEANELWKKSLAFLDPGPLVEESTLRVKSDQDAVIWSEADKLSFDDRLVKDTIATCLADVDGESAIHCVQGLIERRELRAEPSNLLNYGQDSISLLLTDALLREMRTQINESERLDWKPWMGEGVPPASG